MVRIPENVRFEHACFATVGSIAINSVRIARISLGEKVAVIGLGLIGQLVAQLVRLQGGFVIATDLKPNRVELADELGADAALLSEGEIHEHIRAMTDGHGVDCAIVASAAKSAATCQLAVEICRDRGRIVDVGNGLGGDLPHAVQWQGWIAVPTQGHPQPSSRLKRSL